MLGRKGFAAGDHWFAVKAQGVDEVLDHGLVPFVFAASGGGEVRWKIALCFQLGAAVAPADFKGVLVQS